MVKWFESLTKNHLPFTVVVWVRILPGTLDSFMRENYQASLRNVRDSTQVPVSG